ncbi:MAG: pyrrolo-quinoline quinone [Oscillospiraceae bacterium]|nr:pyrrolo-quinoline quinone [Oscillospiraceae bacterium]
MQKTRKNIKLFIKLISIIIIMLLALSACNEADDPDIPPEGTPVVNGGDGGSAYVPTPEPSFLNPRAVSGTQPENMIAAASVMADGQITETFNFFPRFNFAHGDEYSKIEAITTFRGNNFRENASFGYANITEGTLTEIWKRSTGSLTAPDGALWRGHGWTGQPLITKWPVETRAIMSNMFDWAKEQEELTEVIYAAMDGYIYFQELETGKDTRDKLFIGWTFKGSGAIDPRGYPLLYVGAGYDSALGNAKIFIISLIDGAILYTFGQDDSFAPRKLPEPHSYADSSPLICTLNDRLIYPSENGLLYIMDLNTRYNPEFGAISVSPSDIIKWRFDGKRHEQGGMFWYGIESSVSIFEGFAYISDNGGHMLCLNLNTLEIVWVHDSLDDTNNSPVFSIENEKAYIYLGAGFHGGWRAPADTAAQTPIWKLNAETGEIIWQVNYNCHTVSGVSGGIQGTIASGSNSLSDLIFVPVARTPTQGAGVLAAIRKSTGEIVWEHTSVYSWSSPVCVYNADGKGYIIHTDTAGDMFLLDGLTGQLLSSINLGSLVEASPAVFNNIAVVGTKGGMDIRGVRLS